MNQFYLLILGFDLWYGAVLRPAIPLPLSWNEHVMTSQDDPQSPSEPARQLNRKTGRVKRPRPPTEDESEEEEEEPVTEQDLEEWNRTQREECIEE